MTKSEGLEDCATSVVRIAPRELKPRSSGLTILADRGFGLSRQKDILEAGADYVDYAKVGIGAYRIQSEAFVRRKVDTYKENGVKVFFAGDVTEAAFVQGVSREFYASVKDLGGDAVEVSSAQVTMPLADKCALIAMARETGLEVIAEAGQKGHEEWTESINFIYQQIDAYFEAGATKVLIQGEGISEGVESRKEQLLLNLAARFDIKDLIFQAKDSDTQEWFISVFGSVVNLDIDDHQVIDVELMRRGIRKRGVFGLLGHLGTSRPGRSDHPKVVKA